MRVAALKKDIRLMQKQINKLILPSNNIVINQLHPAHVVCPSCIPEKVGVN